MGWGVDTGGGYSAKEQRRENGVNVYLVPAVSQVDVEETHPMEDKLHGSQEVIQNRWLQRSKFKRKKSLSLCPNSFCPHYKVH